MQTTFFDFNCTDTQPIPSTSAACNFSYIGIAITRVDKNPASFYHSKLGKQVNSPYFGLAGGL